MTQEEKIEKSFKIGKIVKYSGELSEVDRKISKSTVALGLCAIAASLNYSLLSRDVLPLGFETVYALGGPFFTGLAVSKLKVLLESINRKTILEMKLEDIDDELDFDKFIQEERGKKL